MTEQYDRMKRLRERAKRQNALGKEAAGFVVTDILTLFEQLDEATEEPTCPHPENIVGNDRGHLVCAYTAELEHVKEERDKFRREMKRAQKAQRDGKWALTDAILTEALGVKCGDCEKNAATCSCNSCGLVMCVDCAITPMKTPSLHFCRDCGKGKKEK